MGTKKYLIVFIILLSMFSVGAQQLKVLNETNLDPIQGVLIYSSDPVISDQTDAKGLVDLSQFGEIEILNFQHPSFQQQRVSLNDLKSSDYIIYLKERIVEIGEIVISANKWEEDKSEIPNEIASISPRQIEFNNPQTAADVLEGSGQVFVQKSQMGGGSPMMRGFAANSVLIVFDGIRMNNAIFRGGNLQNVIQIDPNMLKGAEVIFGPGSVIYGSDALGGVMDFHTIEPEFATNHKNLFFGQAYTRYSSTNNEKTGHFHFNVGGQKLSAATSFSYSDFDDLKTGSNRTDEFPDFGKRPTYVRRLNNEDIIVNNPDENVQRFSGYWQYNFLQKIKWRAADFLDVEYQFYYTTSSDIPRYDRLIEERNGQPRSAEWYYGPQEFMLNALRVNYFRKNRIFDQGRLTISYQDFAESRHDRSFGNPTLRSRKEGLDIYTINLDLDKILSMRHQFFYGIEMNHNSVESTAFTQNVDTGELGRASTRYPDGGSKYFTLAGYLSYKWSITDHWIFTSGARYSFVKLTSQFEDDTFFDFPFNDIEISNGAINGSAGLVYKPKEHTKLNFLISTGFRAPNIDDVAKVFDSEPGSVVVPNEDLKPEYTYNFEIGYSRRIAESVQVSTVAFYTLLEDALVRRDFTFNGEDSILYDGTLSRVRAEVNIGSAYIYGFSFNLRSDITDRIALSSSLTYTDGRDKVEDIPLRHTTPLFGRTAISYAAKKVKAEVFFRYNGKRSFEDLPPSEQSKTHLYTDDGTLAWFTANVRGSYQFTPIFQINGGIENIFDKHYRPYSSGISAPGRNYILALRASF